MTTRRSLSVSGILYERLKMASEKHGITMSKLLTNWVIERLDQEGIPQLTTAEAERRRPKNGGEMSRFSSHKAKHDRETRNVDRWNKHHLVGTRVMYWTGERRGEGCISRTRSLSSIVGGTACVWVIDHPAAIALSHVKPIDEEMEPSKSSASKVDGRGVHQW